MRLVIIVLLLAIIFSLGSALFQIMSKSGEPKNVTRAFTIRIVLSALLIVVLIVSWQLGLVN